MSPRDHVVEIPIPQPAFRDRDIYVPLPAWPSWPWRKLLVTHALAVVGGLLLAAVIYAAGTWDGHAFYPTGNGSGITVRYGQVVRFGSDLENRTGGRIVVTKAAFANVPAGIHVLGVRLQSNWENAYEWRGWPYRSNPDTELVLPPHSRSGGVEIGVRAEHPGTYVFHGIRVWYRSGFGLPLLGQGHWTQTTGLNYQLRVSSP